MTVISPSRSVSTQQDSHERPVSMVERMTLIMDAFDRRFVRLTLEEIACRTGLPRSTAHRILEQLVRLDWLERTDAGYGLGTRALGFGGQENIRSEVREAAAPILFELHRRTGMIVHLAVLDGSDVLYLDKVGGHLPRELPSRVGGRVPAHATALGKALLAWHSIEHVDSVMRGKLVRYARRTIGDMATLHHELDRIRQRRGLAFERGESCQNVGCVGAAIRGQEGPIAGISLCGDEEIAQLERVAPLVFQATREISRSLFPETKATRRVGDADQVPVQAWSSEAMDRLMRVGRDGEWF